MNEIIVRRAHMRVCSEMITRMEKLQKVTNYSKKQEAKYDRIKKKKKTVKGIRKMFIYID